MNTNSPISLFHMPVGTMGKIVQIDGGYGMSQRLDAMGIRVGSKIQKLTGQLMRGPVMLRVGNTRVAIGFGMARRIWVEIEK
jgi:ferrous iron transport protein A